MIVNGIRMRQSKQDVYNQLSKEHLIHLIGEYQHALDRIEANYLKACSSKISDMDFYENLRNILININTMYSPYDTKELSDEIDFRMGKFDVNEWRIRRGFESDKEFDRNYWNLEEY